MSHLCRALENSIHTSQKKFSQRRSPVQDKKKKRKKKKKKITQFSFQNIVRQPARTSARASWAFLIARCIIPFVLRTPPKGLYKTKTMVFSFSLFFFFSLLDGARSDSRLTIFAPFPAPCRVGGSGKSEGCTLVSHSFFLCTYTTRPVSVFCILTESLARRGYICTNVRTSIRAPVNTLHTYYTCSHIYSRIST